MTWSSDVASVVEMIWWKYTTQVMCVNHWSQKNISGSVTVGHYQKQTQTWKLSSIHTADADVTQLVGGVYWIRNNSWASQLF